MKHTPISRWLRAIVIDTVFTGGLILAIYTGVITTQNTIIFLLWWMTAIAFVALIFIIMFCIIRKDHPDPDVRKISEDFWTPKTIAKLAYTKPFAAYHFITDFILIVTLAMAGYTGLASMVIINRSLGAVVIAEARKRQDA